MEARFLAAVIRRSWLVILIVGLVGLVAGAAIAERSSRRYVSQASVSVTVPYTSALLGTPPEAPGTYLATQVGIISSDTTAKLVVKKLPGETYRTIEKQLKVSRSGGSDIIDISATTGSPTLSARIANATTAAYVTEHLASVNGPLSQELASINNQLAGLSVRIAAAKINSGLLAALQTQYNQLSQTGHQAALALQLNATTISMVAPATPPITPLPRHGLEDGLLGLLAGLVVSYVVALVVAASRPRLHSAADLEDALGLPIAVALPASPARGASPSLNGAAVEGRGAKLGARRAVAGSWDREMVRICALVEAIPSARLFRSVLVVATENGSGALELAKEISRRFQVAGEKVRFAELRPGAPQDRQATSVAPSPVSAPGGTGQVPGGEQPGLRRSPAQSPDSVLSADLVGQLEGDEVSMVILAGGVLGESTESVVLARSTDLAIVVATIPSARMREQVVQAVRSSLADSRAQVLLVTIPPDHRNGT